MLYTRRRQMEAMQKQENEGKSFWTRDVPPQLRQKLIWRIERHGAAINSYDPTGATRDIYLTAHHVLTQDLGVEHLQGIRNSDRDFEVHIRDCSHEDFPDVLEALAIATAASTQQLVINKENAKQLFNELLDDINNLLQEYRVAFTLERLKVVDFTSRELHVAVVEPVLQLIHQPGWEAAEQAYQKALQEIGVDPSDSITDATTALQEGLRAVGCKGGDFASLAKNAKQTILKGYDEKYLQAIEKLIDWASASRVNKGDTHKTTTPTSDDAWFVVHLVGALLLRLSKL